MSDFNIPVPVGATGVILSFRSEVVETLPAGATELVISFAGDAVASSKVLTDQSATVIDQNSNTVVAQ